MNEEYIHSKTQFIENLLNGDIHLKNIPINFRDDFDIVLVAVSKNGISLEFSSENLKNNYEIVLAAITQNGTSLQYASNELKNNKKIVVFAMNQHQNNFKYASELLRNDQELLESYIDLYLKDTSITNKIVGSDFYKECLYKLNIIKENQWLENKIPINDSNINHKINKF